MTAFVKSSLVFVTFIKASGLFQVKESAKILITWSGSSAAKPLATSFQLSTCLLKIAVSSADGADEFVLFVTQLKNSVTDNSDNNSFFIL